MIVNTILRTVCELYVGVLLVYVLMSWLPTDRGIIGDIYTALGRLCDPFLDLFKRIIPPIGGVLDITPIFAIIVVQLIERLIAMFVRF